ncbi:hypothetical protein E3E29_08280 [Thermococcus sp. Bubb.Bath]|nr:hypothetical protein [Thermococcus sp. Bubb.Bath]
MPEPTVGSVISEIEKRMKRLQAMVEIAEESLRFEEGRRKAPKPSQGNMWTYLITALAWTLGGLFILYLFRSRYSGVVGGAPTGVSIVVYAIIALGIVAVLLFYYLPRRRGAVEEFDLDERARAAKLLIKNLYAPLKEALLEDNDTALGAMADKLLEDPLLAHAMEVVREGDPRLAAYALYLYVSFKSGNVSLEDVAEAVEKVDNRPLQLLLESLLPEEGSIIL